LLEGKRGEVPAIIEKDRMISCHDAIERKKKCERDGWLQRWDVGLRMTRRVEWRRGEDREKDGKP